MRAYPRGQDRNPTERTFVPGRIATVVLALGCAPKEPVKLESSEVEPPAAALESAPIDPPDVGMAADQHVEPHRVDDLAAWTRDCDAIDRMRKVKDMPPAQLKCPIRGDFDGDGKPDEVEVRGAKTDGTPGLAVRWGDGSFSMLGGGRRVLMTGAPLPTHPYDRQSDQVFETMDWIAEAKVLPLREGRLRYTAGSRMMTVEGFESIAGDALYVSGDDAAGLFYFDVAGDRWRFVHLGF